MDFMRIFSLKSRTTFVLLVVALCIFSVGAWWSVRTLVASEIQARLQSDADRLVAALEERMRANGNALVSARAHLLNAAGGTARFGEFVEDLDLAVRSPGMRGIGFAKRLPVAGAGEFRSAVELFEPADWRNRRVLGVDLFRESNRLKAVRSAIATGDVALARPAVLDPTGGESWSMLVAAYPGRAGGEREVTGVVFAPFRLRDVFEAALGAPSLQRESVNFVLLSDDTDALSPLYNRFGLRPLQIEPWALVERPLYIYGANLRLRVYPMDGFYSFADRYLAMIVGLGAALLSCLVMIVMRVSQNQLEFEILAKESSMEAALQGRRQIENLRKLNDFDRSLAGELDLEVIVKQFFTSLNQLTQVDGSFLFFARKQTQSNHLGLHNVTGFSSGRLKRNQIPAAWVDRLFTQSLYLRKGDNGAEGVLRQLTDEVDAFTDWVLAAVTTRESGRCGLVFAGRRGGAAFSEVDREMFESMISQFASSIEIAQLFSRVEDASKAKNAFLANMSHEIRTPLSAIIGFSEMLSQDRVTPEQKGTIVENLRKNGEQLTCIIDDILDLSKVEAGKMRIERRRVRLASVVQGIRAAMELRARDKNIEFLVVGEGKLPTHVETDEVRLKQILMNLVGNAIKFTERGEVRMSLRHLSGEGGDQIAFTIKDTGIGISEEARSQLFSPFSQGDMSHTRKFGGSGLGLALSRRLAQELGGDIRLLESSKGVGSTFEARVAAGNLAMSGWSENLFPPPVVAATARLPDSPKLEGCKILVVEDSEDNQEIFRFFLENVGAKTDIVSDGIQAVKTAANGNYDMILMDVQIPGIDGKEATRRIRQQGFGNPIVALTAHAMPGERESCMRAGCNGQITKPISGEALVSRIAEFLGRVG